jgi:hypothetical protein
LIFNRPEAKHHGVVAGNAALAQGLQSLWAHAISEKR